MKSLRILFNAYPTQCQGGGSVVKLRKLRDHLRTRGHVVDFFDPWSSDLNNYDIYHHFSWFPADLPMIRYAKAEGVKVVIETMYWDSLRHALGSQALDWKLRGKALIKLFIRTSLPWCSLERKILRMADLLMPNSALEAGLLVRHFRVDPKKIAIVYNGVDPRFAHATPELFIQRYGLKDFVLATGMLEARKNQITLIRAMKGTGIPLVLIGSCPGVHRGYLERCRQEADGNTHFLGPIDHDNPLLASAYAASRVLAMPSWHETTGKSALEAALAGKNVVMTTYAPAAREYLGSLISYVDPADVAGIRRTILGAYGVTPNEALRRHVEERFLWENVVEARERAYEKLLSP